ncbi:hypothetical protein Q604_UNBC03327G0001, partial [human gut metagenome]
ALRPASQQIPVIAAEMERSSAAGRVLVLTSTSEGMSVSLWRGDGTRLLDTTPDVLAAFAVRDPWGRTWVSTVPYFGATSKPSPPRP